MTVATSIHRRNRKSGSKPRSRQSLQKPNGVIGPRVAKVGGDRFAIVCIDPAKYRSEWLMADYFGKILIAQRTLEHQAAFFKLAFAQIREAQEQHGIEDILVCVERTGNFYLIPKRAFAKAGFEIRVVHPFATKQYRKLLNLGSALRGVAFSPDGSRIAIVGSDKLARVVGTDGRDERARVRD
jgi:hypothetical protein